MRRSLRAITLTQPWATCVALGVKHYETRPFQVSYRGPLAIHAGKGLALVHGKKGLAEMLGRRPFQELELVPEALPLGRIVAVCELTDCLPTVEVDDPDEFGWYAPGRFAWRLENVVAVPEPIEASGHLGLWTVDKETRQFLLGLLEEARPVEVLDEQVALFE